VEPARIHPRYQPCTRGNPRTYHSLSLNGIEGVRLPFQIAWLPLERVLGFPCLRRENCNPRLLKAAALVEALRQVVRVVVICSF
jgi:hypothetical protein